MTETFVADEVSRLFRLPLYEWYCKRRILPLYCSFITRVFAYIPTRSVCVYLLTTANNLCCCLTSQVFRIRFKLGYVLKSKSCKCILNTFASCLLHRVNGVLLTYSLWFGKHRFISSHGDLQAAVFVRKTDTASKLCAVVNRPRALHAYW